MSEWLLGTLLATSVLTGLVLLVREPVRRTFGSRVTYGLWLIPAARLFMPTLTTTVERVVPAASPIRPHLQTTLGDPLLLSNVASPASSLLAEVGGWTSVLSVVWLAVASMLFLSRMIAFRRDRLAILTSADEITRLGSVRIVCSAEVASPVAFGIVDRVIAIPADFERLYDARERRFALEHELAHHKSGDLVANLFAFVLLCLQWFNPLAWVAHAAFRFDQEAACDARVLDKANADDRADYGRAIAKAASGRALLFASALDRRNSLHRRLKSMLRNSNPNQRLAGRLLVATAVAVALPLTASRAVDYIDVPAPADHPSAAPAAAAPAPIPAAKSFPAVRAAIVATTTAPAQPIPATPSEYDGDVSISGDLVTIDGRTKRWEELTPAEKDRLRNAVNKARQGLAKAQSGRDRAMRDASEAVRRLDIAKLQRDVAEARENSERALRGLDENHADLRRFGVDTERLSAEVRRSLSSIDAEQIQRSLADIDPQKLAATMAGAEAAMHRAQADLDRLDARLRAEGH